MARGARLAMLSLALAGCTLSFDAPADGGLDARVRDSGTADGRVELDAPPPPPIDGAVPDTALPDGRPLDGPAPPPPPPPDADTGPTPCDLPRCPHTACTQAYCDGRLCAERPLPAGSSCDDGDACTIGDACDAEGICRGGPSCDDGNPCTLESCGPSGCDSMPAPNGTACAHPLGGGQCCAGACRSLLADPANCGDCGLSCGFTTRSRLCIGGSCTECTNDLDCAPPTASCVRRADCLGGRCDIETDGGCFIEGRCWAPGERNPANPCEVCSGRATRWNAMSTCDDGSFCTAPDVCSTAICSSGPPRNCDDGNPCTADSCDEAADRCDHEPLPDGIGCEDGDLCTTGDRCVSGSCMPRGVVTCSGPAPVCHTYGCNSATGDCQNLPEPDGTTCDDGDCCTTGDACATVGGVTDCRGSAPPSDDCNTYVCEASCQHRVATPGTSCTNTSCASGAVCDGAGACICL